MGILDAPTANPVRDVPLIERRQIDSNGAAFNGDSSTWVYTGAGQFIGSPIPVTLPWAYWVESVILSSNRTILVTLFWGSSAVTGSGTAPLTTIQLILPANIPVTVPVRLLIRGGVNSTGGSLFVNAYLDATPAGAGTRVYASATGFSFSDDLDMAAKPILFLGDSLMAGTGPSIRDNFLPWMIRRYYSDKGQRVRMLNQSVSGSTTAGHDSFLKSGRYDHDKLAGIVYMLGVNDAAQSLSAASAGSRLSAAIAWKQARYPAAKMLVLSPPPLENNTSETNLVAIRSAQASAVTAASDSKVKYLSLAGAFDRTVSGNYVGSDTAGSRIHPGDTGIGQIWNGGFGGFAGLKAFLDSNLATL